MSEKSVRIFELSKIEIILRKKATKASSDMFDKHGAMEPAPCKCEGGEYCYHEKHEEGTLCGEMISIGSVRQGRAKCSRCYRKTEGKENVWEENEEEEEDGEIILLYYPSPSTSTSTCALAPVTVLVFTLLRHHLLYLSFLCPYMRLHLSQRHRTCYFRESDCCSRAQL